MNSTLMFAKTALDLDHMPRALQYVRRKLDMSCRAVGEECGLSWATIWRAELGEDIRVSSAVRILRWIAEKSPEVSLNVS